MSNELQFSVPGMTCGHCVNAITSEVKDVHGVSDVTINLETKLVNVRGEDLNDDAIRAAITEAGYDAE